MRTKIRILGAGLLFLTILCSAQPNHNRAHASVCGSQNFDCMTIALGAVNYQLGLGWRTKFPNTWNMIKQGKYCEAADALEGTLWNIQTPVRVDDFQKTLRDQSAGMGKPC